MRPDHSADLLGVVAQGSDTAEKERGTMKCVDFDASCEDHHCSTDIAEQALHDTELEDHNARQLLRYDATSGSTVEECCQVNGVIDDCNNNITNDTNGKSWVSGEEATDVDGINGHPSLKSPTNNGSVNATSSDAAGSKEMNAPSPSTLWQAKDIEGCDKDLVFGGFVMEDMDSIVSLHADYIIYQNRYYPAPMLIVSDMHVRIEGLAVNQDAEPSVSEWGIEDIYCIESQWCNRVNVVRGRLCFLAKGLVQNEIMQNAAGIEEIKFAIYDPQWVYRLEKIMSLNRRYQAAWKVLPPVDDFDVEDALPIDKSEFFSRPYFPNFEEHFEEVVYPEGDIDAVSICKRDVDLLQPETFINDTIIDFYIKFLKIKIEPEEKNRFHFFNSFFFRKLADLDKNPESAFDGKAAFQRVRKWTRKLNLFEKDYIFIPVNYRVHWSLIVICHPGEVAGSIDGEHNGSSKVPCILHMDSIRGSHSGLKDLIQSYLCEEWKERHKDTPEDIALKFLNLRFLSLELPQQENFYDCGLFLLHYVELFVEDAPRNFDPFKINKFSNFLTADWFLPAEVSLKRAYIQRLISKILHNHSRRGDQSCASDELCSFKPQKHSTTDQLAIGLSSVIGGADYSKSPNACYLGSTSSCSTSQSISPPALSLYDPASTSGSLFGQYQQYDMQGGSYSRLRGNMSPIQEEDDDEHIVYSGRRASDSNQLNYVSEGCSNDGLLGNQYSWAEEEDGDEVDDTDDDEEEGVSTNEEQHEDDISSDESGLNSDDEDENSVKLIEESSLRREARHDEIKNQYHELQPQRCPLIDNLDSLDDSFASAPCDMMLETLVEDSEEQDDDNSESEHPVCRTSVVVKHSAWKEPQQDQDQVTGEYRSLEFDTPHDNGNLETDRGDACLDWNNQRVESGDGTFEDEQYIVCDSSSDSDDEPRSAKRLRLSPSKNHGEMKLTSSLFRGVDL